MNEVEQLRRALNLTGSVVAQLIGQHPAYRETVDQYIEALNAGDVELVTAIAEDMLDVLRAHVSN